MVGEAGRRKVLEFWERYIRKLVDHWLPELSLLDKLQPNPNVFSTPIMTAAFLSLRRYQVAELRDDTADRHAIMTRALQPKKRIGEAPRRKVLEFWA